MPVDEVFGGPVMVVKGIPRRVVVVERDRIVDAQRSHRPPDVRRDVLEGELGRVDADDHETLRAVRGVPALEVRKRPEAVHARVRPEVDEDDLPAQGRQRERG